MHKATRIASDTIEYRGIEIMRDNSVSRGYYGAYRVGGFGRFSKGTDSLKEAKRHVDKVLDAPNGSYAL